MHAKVAINGYGRIGRSILRALYESGMNKKLQLVALNNRGDIDACAQATCYDTTHGRFNFDVSIEGDHLIIGRDRIRYLSETDPAKLPWREIGVDIVFECTGKFNSKECAQVHLDSGAGKVLLSAPGKGVDVTVVFGVNHQTIQMSDRLVSNASCTTNCLVPVVKALNDSIGIVRGLLTTVHAYTNDQVLIDGNHKDLRRARSATTSMIPTKTGAAQAVGLVLPELAGKLHGYAIRVPTLNVSLIDLTLDVARQTTIDEVNTVIKRAAEGAMKNILEYCDMPLVSIDFNHNSASSIYDATLTQVMDGTLVKVSAWYDNEWGYANRMLDTALFMSSIS